MYNTFDYFQFLIKMRPVLFLTKRCLRPGFLIRSCSTNQPSKPTGAASAPKPAPASTASMNVPGLSQAVHTTQEPVGPGASKNGEYKVPEYFNYHRMSYFEAEIEMAKYRCPQPSALPK